MYKHIDYTYVYGNIDLASGQYTYEYCVYCKQPIEIIKTYYVTGKALYSIFTFCNETCFNCYVLKEL